MKNKKNLIKIGVISFAIWCLSLSFSSAVTLHLTGLKDLKAVNENELTNKIIQIHFADNWNNFGWFIYYGNIDEESTTEPGGQFQVAVQEKDDWYICKNQLKWFYYNAERWERLWPLDEDTKKSRSNSLTMSWWIFTACDLSWYTKLLEDCNTDQNKDAEECIAEVNKNNSAADDGYYGSISHNYSGKDMRLIMWVRYKTPTDINTKDFIKIDTGTTLFPSFKRLSNKYPVGFIYDYNGWVGLAWCHIEGEPLDGIMFSLIKELNESWIDNMFKKSDNSDAKVEYIWSAVDQPNINCSSISTEDTLSKVVIEWIVWASDKWSDYGTIFTQMGNQSDQKMQYFTTANVDNDTLMNYARKKAEILCRWKWKSEIGHITNWGKVVCIKGWDITADESNQIKEAGKTLIVKGWWNVTITPMTWADKGSDNYYDIFIDNGNLIIKEDNDKNKIASGTNEELFVFTKEWFMSDKSYSGFNDMLSGAGIYDNDYTWNDIAVWAFIRWNFIVNGHVQSAVDNEGLKHKYFIYWKFSTLDWFKELENTFSWRCKHQISNEPYKFFCPRIEWNPYANAALVIIDQNYPSTFYNN